MRVLTTAVVASLLVGCGDDDDTGTDTAPSPPAPLAAGTLEWITLGNGPERQRCYSVAESGEGTLVALCSHEGVSTWATGTPEEVEVTSEGELDIVVLGLDPEDGALRWSITAGGPGWESWWVSPVATLSDGRVAVLFRAGGPLTSSPLPVPDAAEGDLILLVLRGDGTVDNAVRLAAGGSFDYPNAAAITPLSTGGFLLSAQFTGSLTLAPGTAGETALAGMGDADRFNTVVSTWDADLALGGLLHLGEAGHVLATAIPDEDGGMTLAGWFTNELALPGAATMTDPDGLGQAFVTSLDPAGEARFALSFGGEGEDWAYDLARLPDGGVVVGGYYGAFLTEAVTFDVPGAEGSPLQGVAPARTCQGGAELCASDQFVLTLGADGAPRWLRGVSSPHLDSIRNVDVFDDGAILVGGFANADSNTPNGPRIESMTFSDGEVVEVEDRVTLTMRYEADGTRAWTRWTTPSLGWAAVVLDDGRVAQCSAYQEGAVFGAGEENETEPPFTGQYDGAVFVLASGD